MRGAVLSDLGNGYFLSRVSAADENAVVEHLGEREIYEYTLRIPYPYRPEHFRTWFASANPEHVFAIRAPDGRLVGVTGFNILEPGHLARIGYWLAKPLWGRGVMTAAVAALVRIAFEQHGVVRVEADVFANNPRSARVLEKNGFVLEGTLRKLHRKDGRFIDARLYALVR